MVVGPETSDATNDQDPERIFSNKLGVRLNIEDM
jgi:hypothetical protein